MTTEHPVEKHKFTVVASSNKFASAEATWTITVVEQADNSD